MDHTMGNNIAQQQMMSTTCKMSRQVNQDLGDMGFQFQILMALNLKVIKNKNKIKN
jgi:hypothetical protein